MLTIDGIKLVMYPNRSIETVNEVILKQYYDFSEVAGSHIMIDIGMNVGITTLLKANNPSFHHIYSFEPLKPTYEIARSNMSLILI
jgi:tRNA1(Val) A37 N6-methylase TrmN6